MEDQQPSCSNIAGPARSSCYEYEAMHFGFSPKSLADTIYNVALDVAIAGTAATEQELLSEVVEEDRKAAVKAHVHLMSTGIEKALDHVVVPLQDLSLKKIFRIPSYVSLPEDAIHNPPLGPVTYTEHLKALTKAKHLEKDCSVARFCLNARKEEIELIRNLKNMASETDHRLFKIAFSRPGGHVFITKLAVLIGNKTSSFKLCRGKVIEDHCVPLNGSTNFRFELQFFAKAEVANGLKLLHVLSCGRDSCVENRIEQEVRGPIENGKTLLTVLPIMYTSPEISLPSGGGTNGHSITIISTIIHCAFGACAQWRWTIER